MPRRSVHQLADGDSFDDVYLAAEKQLRSNRNGQLFLQVELRDRTGSISARLWNATEAQFHSFDDGDFLRVRGKAQLFQGAMQVVFTHFDKVSPTQVHLPDFLPQTEQDVSKMWERTRTLLRGLGDAHLRALAECFFMDEAFVAAFCKAPAGIKNHHAYLGGLLEHVLTMMESADRIAPLYAGLNRDFLLMGVFLHDMGKIHELSYERVFGYSDVGQLVGHIDMGVEMLSAKISQAEKLTGEPFPLEHVYRLKHLIVSHHGTYEFGSPRLPMTPEAIALYILDNLDAKLHATLRDIRDDRNPATAWTQYNPQTQRRLFKGLREGSEPVEG
jgi:3'-5' exoribonuclease